MVWLFGTVALAIVFGIAAVVVGREARRLDAEPPRAVFDLDEATEWVANHVPFEVSAALSYEDVRRILEWNLEYLRVRGLSDAHPGQRSSPTFEVLVDQGEVIRYVLGRAQAAGDDFPEAGVIAVLEAQIGYFDAIGAIGPRAAPEDPQ